MKIKLLSFAIITTLFTESGIAQVNLENNDRLAIKQCVDHYFAGVESANAKELSKAFYQGAMMFWTGDDGQVNYLTQKKWKSKLSGIKNPEKANSRDVQLIDLTGDIAIVKAESTFPDKIYYDYLALVKSKEGWRITNKVFAKESVPGGQILKNNAGDVKQIQNLVETQLRSMDTNDADLLASVYFPRAMSYYVDEKELVGVPINEWVARFAFDKRNNTPITKAIRQIQKIDCTGSVGYAKFTHDVADHITTDYILLLKNGGRWYGTNLMFTSIAK